MTGLSGGAREGPGLPGGQGQEARWRRSDWFGGDGKRARGVRDAETDGGQDMSGAGWMSPDMVVILSLTAESARFAGLVKARHDLVPLPGLGVVDACDRLPNVAGRFHVALDPSERDRFDLKPGPL